MSYIEISRFLNTPASQCAFVPPTRFTLKGRGRDRCAERTAPVASQREMLFVVAARTNFDIVDHLPHVVGAVVALARAAHVNEPTRSQGLPVAHGIHRAFALIVSAVALALVNAC